MKTQATKSKARNRSKEREKRIVTEGADKGLPHRADFTSCPECGHDTRENEPWWKTAHTLVLRPAIFKAGHVTIISECPKCFASSWVHQRMGFCFAREIWPVGWNEAVEAESARLRLLAVREWPKHLCWKCRHLESATIEFHCYRYCIVGCGGPVSECRKFEAV